MLKSHFPVYRKCSVTKKYANNAFSTPLPDSTPFSASILFLSALGTLLTHAPHPRLVSLHCSRAGYGSGVISFIWI